MKRKNINQLLYAVLGLLVLSLIGCAPQQSQAPSRPASDTRPAFLEHEIMYSGETLGLISRWYTGNTQNWQKIIAANPGLRPERLRLGQIVRIPRELVVEERPMPQQFVRSTTNTAPTETAPAKTEPSGATITSGSQPTEAAAGADPLLEALQSDDTTDASTAATINEASGGQAAPVVSSDAVTETKAVEEISQPAPVETLDSAAETTTAPAPSDESIDRDKLLEELLRD